MDGTAWFTIDRADADTYIISEYGHWEETHCYLLNGKEKSLLIDTGLGVADIGAEISKLTDRPVFASATHVHWDHIGGHRYFPDFGAHELEADWLNGHFPLPIEAVKSQLTSQGGLPDSFNIDNYQLFQGKPSVLLKDMDIIDLGGRRIRVLHTPGHSPGHMCFWEEERQYLFTGDLVYKGDLFAHYPTTSLEAFLSSIERAAGLPAVKLFPGHHSLGIEPEIIPRIREALRRLHDEGRLHHGGGRFSYGDWGIWI